MRMRRGQFDLSYIVYLSFALVIFLLFKLLTPPPPPALTASISNPTVVQGNTQIQFSSGCQLYAYGFTNGGASFNSGFANGQTITVTDVNGQVAAGLAVSTSN
ncbi:MAG: hypothetical protein ACP5T1_06865, partial [Thermoplasmata archaeon]